MFNTRQGDAIELSTLCFASSRAGNQVCVCCSCALCCAQGSSQEVRTWQKRGSEVLELRTKEILGLVNFFPELRVGIFQGSKFPSSRYIMRNTGERGGRRVNGFLLSLLLLDSWVFSS